MAASPCCGESRISTALRKPARRSHRERAATYPIAVTTNGVLIDDEWLDCFETHNISVAISLDGPAHIHDLHRRTFQGTGTHAAVERAARMLAAARHRRERAGGLQSRLPAGAICRVFRELRNFQLRHHDPGCDGG